MRFTITNIVLLLLLLITGSFSFVQYTNLQEAEEKIKQFQDIERLNERSEDFIRALFYGKHKKFLTGNLLEEYKSSQEEHGEHLEENIGEINELKVQQLFTKRVKNEDDVAESYAIVQVRYETGESSNIQDDYIQTLSIKSHWIKESKTWKVDDLEMFLLSDSQDELLRKQAENK